MPDVDRIRHITSRALWRIMWKPGRRFLEWSVRFQVKGEENLRGVEGPVIVAANHVHTVDGFLLGGALPKDSPFIPLRFGVWHKYYWHFFNFPALFLLGTFEVRRKVPLEIALKAPIRLLKKGYSVGIFPEGKRRHLGRPRRGRRGAPYLAMTQQVPILPMYIDGGVGLKYKDFIRKNRSITVIIGKPLMLPDREPTKETLKEMGDMIMEQIWTLKSEA